ncbi:acetolactate synthase large subunit [Paenibacillus mucilaginosus 3016]|uniref:Acetolactate synthase large subunit n=1 Tax=Paenibacillus mucilaginosus 3016 TaxID=1116391 RepID=H6NHK4_9BACL|nr:thiamine pyrophosphate-binding protein [Paenibacillus mucilaginosus]AFC29601.1 acetolactate synthase large subunit [Paenibacillus mucilaginosus 3016]WFA18283.1 thiamine pyrophosphate-binding protein [Paenibacillus mucilaginosus]
METVASSLVRHLHSWGIRHAFGVPGKAIVPLILELGNQNVEFVLSRHEGGAGFSAAGYALMNGRLGVAIGTSGPGGTNMLTAAGQAKAYHLPVLFITGHASSKDSGRPLGQDSTFFAADLARMFEPVTLFSARVERSEQFPVYLQHAVERALTGVRGPVHLSIPQDVLTEPVRHFELELPALHPALRSPRLKEAAELLEQAHRPALLLGKGVHISGAYEAVEAFAERWQIPVMTTPGGKGAFRSRHPLHIGPYGLGGCPEASEYLKSGIDLFVAIGTKLSDMSLPAITEDMIPQAVLHFDIDGTFVGKSFPAPALFIQGDAKANLEALLELAAERAPEVCGAYAEAAAALQTPDLSENEVMKAKSLVISDETQPLITAVQVMEVLGRCLPSDVMVFGDDGSHSYHAIRSLDIHTPGSFRFDDVFAAMGHAIGFSIGAKIASPDRTVVCLTGDGCMFMHGTEISTAVNNGAGVIFIVLNNGRLDMVNKGMRHATGRSDGTVYETPLQAALLAEALGASAFTASSPPELEGALEKALQAGKAAVIEVLVDPEEIPPTLARG